MLNSSFLMPWQTRAAAFLTKALSGETKSTGPSARVQNWPQSLFQQNMQEQPLYTGITGKLGHGAAIWSASWLGLHDTGVTLQWTAGRGQSCPGWDLPLKKQDLLGTKNKMELHFRADLSSASDRFVNKVQNSRVDVGDHRNLPKWWIFVVNRGEKETSLFHTQLQFSNFQRDACPAPLDAQTNRVMARESFPISQGLLQTYLTNNLVKIM